MDIDERGFHVPRRRKRKMVEEPVEEVKKPKRKPKKESRVYVQADDTDDE